MKDLSHWGDIAAIPFFLLLMIYFADIPQKSTLEWVFLGFASGGLIADMIFTYIFLYDKQKK
jgi:hypothetical protein